MEKFLKILFSFVLSLVFMAQLAISQPITNKEATISVFSAAQGKYLYLANIQYKDNTITGVLLIKKSKDGSFRIAMDDELGLGIFEMEFFPNTDSSFILHSCVGYLDKKILIKTLQRDFESLFLTFSAWKEPKINGDTYHYCYQGKRIYKVNKYGDILQMERKRFGLKKESIQLEVIKNPYPQSINIQHYNIDLTITLEYIK